jgi:DNA-directed RNA polymerase specialized sigma24 family protein/ribosome-associated translation inhibitor RaiA
MAKLATCQQKKCSNKTKMESLIFCSRLRIALTCVRTGVESILRDKLHGIFTPSSEARMNVHFTYKVNKTPDIEKEINHQIEKFRKRLQVFRPELIHLKGIVEQNSPREGFQVSLNLRLPSGQMAVQQTAPTANAVVKTAFDELLKQLTKHKEMLRSSHKWTRRRSVTNRREEPASVPFEQTLAAVQPPAVSPEDIRTYVNANLSRLERFVDREIQYREAADLLPTDSITREEIIDEAVARALGDGIEKPERLTLEPWLYQLSMRVLDELARDGEGIESVRWEDSARKSNVRATDEAHLQYHQPDETLTRESTIRDDRTATPEDIAASDEMVAMVYMALRSASDVEREAFILNAVEGFTIEEIAAISERTPEEVRSSIQGAREQLRRSPPVANRLKDKLLQKTGII